MFLFESSKQHRLSSQNAIRIILTVLILVCLSAVCSHATSGGKTIKDDEVGLYRWDWVEGDEGEEYQSPVRESKERNFRVSRKGYLRVIYSVDPVPIRLDEGEFLEDKEKMTKGTVKFSIQRNGKTIYTYKLKTKGYSVTKKIKGWFPCPVKVRSGNYTLKISGTGIASQKNIYGITQDYYATYDVAYKIERFKYYSKKAKVKEKVSAKKHKWVKIARFGKGLPYFKRIVIKNKKAVTDWKISTGGRLYVKTGKKGKAKVIFKLRNGKKYKSVVKVS